MKHYWLTQHYPHPKEVTEQIRWNLYLKKGKKDRSLEVSVDDEVAFYETIAPDPVDPKRRKGRGAVICTGVVKSKVQGNTAARRVRNIDGRIVEFSWEIPCHLHKHGYPVPVQKLREILNR